MITNIALAAIAIAPALYIYLNSIRRRKLAEAELAIAKSVSAMELQLLAGNPKNGDCCRDYIFEIMRGVQTSRQYPLRWNIFCRPSELTTELAKKLAHELDDHSCPTAKAVEQFVNGYYRAVRAKRPFVAILHVAYLSVLIFALRVAHDGLSAFIDYCEKRDERRSEVRSAIVAAAAIREPVSHPFRLAAS